MGLMAWTCSTRTTTQPAQTASSPPDAAESPSSKPRMARRVARTTTTTTTEARIGADVGDVEDAASRAAARRHLWPCEKNTFWENTRLLTIHIFKENKLSVLPKPFFITRVVQNRFNSIHSNVIPQGAEQTEL
eukprot:PhM_4_TR15936/c0_g1_i1/m.221